MNNAEMSPAPGPVARAGYSMVAATLFLGLMISIWPGTAHAGYSFCNKTSYPLQTAIGRGHTGEETVVTRGWWKINPGKCSVVLDEDVVPGRYYVYAESQPVVQGPKRSWSGPVTLCVGASTIFSQNDQQSCLATGKLSRGFAPVDVTAADNGDQRTDFHESRNYNSYTAEIAGTQRLLATLGYKVTIDASMGRNTRNAILRFRRDQNMPPSSLIDEVLISRLTQAAARKIARFGLFYCNRTNANVWSALLEESGNSRIAQGWWSLKPQECVKIRNRALKGRYYVYAQQQKNGEIYEIMNGRTVYCFDFVRFDLKDIADCRNEGLQQGLFVPLEVENTDYHVVDFQTAGFSTTPTSYDIQSIP